MSKIIVICGGIIGSDLILKCIHHANVGSVAAKIVNQPKRRNGKRKAKNWDSPYPS